MKFLVINCEPWSSGGTHVQEFYCIVIFMLYIWPFPSRKVFLSPGEKLYLSKMITVDQKTTTNIPLERYCLGYVLNHHNRHTR